MTGQTAVPLGPEAIAGLLEAALLTVSAELRALGPEAGWRPAEGEWSANECVGHLAEAERRGFNGRIRRMLAEERPFIVGWDQEATARERADHLRPPDEVLGEFRELRLDSIALVRGLSAADLERSGVHEQVGELFVRDLLGEWVHHDRNHVRQLLAVTQARVWDQMGNARRFVEEE